MQELSENELHRLKELLSHSSEFIAYFEHADSKMLEWRHELEGHTNALKKMIQDLESKLTSCNNLLSQTGISTMQSLTEKALSKGDATLRTLEKSYVDLNQHLQEQQEQLRDITQSSIQNIETHTKQTVETITRQLSKYDVKQFHRIANESCDHVERVANNAVNKSNRLFHLFQLRFGMVTAITTIITAFIVVLYLTDEMPWEMHQQAHNERQAGRLLLEAWPALSQQEKSKILNHRESSSG